MFFIGLSREAIAQASLLSENMRDDITVDYKGQKLTYTVLRDAQKRDIFYYVPNEPRLYERQLGGSIMPEFALIRYQAEKPEGGNKPLEGGILQFATTYAAPDVLDQVRKQIAQRFESVSADKIKLSALIPKEATLHVYAPASKELLGSRPLGEGTAAAFANQKMVVSMELTRVGADVFDALTEKNTGVPVAIELTYQGLVHDGGFEVTVDWDQLYDHYSKDEKFRARASWYGQFGGGASHDRTSIRDTLTQNRIIKVHSVTSESFDNARLDSYLQPILSRINAEMLENFKPPAAIQPAQVGEPSTGKGWFGGVGYSVAFKNVTNRKTGSETFAFVEDKLENRKTVVAGFIGIGAYDQAMREQMVTIVPPSPLKTAYLMLPTDSSLSSLGVTDASLQTDVVQDGVVKTAKSVVWKSASGWVDQNNQATNVLMFPLTALGISDVTTAHFQQQAYISRGTTALQVGRSMPIQEDGLVTIAPTSMLVDALEVNGQDLSFRQLEPSAKLSRVAITLTTPKGTQYGSLAAYRNGSAWEPAHPVVFLVAKEEGPLRMDIWFILSDGTEVAYDKNGSDARSVARGLQIDLVDAHWKK